MTARTHDLAALNALAIIALLSPGGTVTLGTALIALLANQIGGIAPDIDQPTAPLWRNLPIFRVFGKFTGKLLGGHRFLSHSILGVVLFGFLSKALLAFIHPIMPRIDTSVVWWAFMIGLVSHLVMDTLTKEGVPWLLPLPWKIGLPPFKKLRITTGKFGEKGLFVAIIAIDMWYVSTHYHYLSYLFHQHIL